MKDPMNITMRSRHFVDHVSEGFSVSLLTELSQYLERIQNERQMIAPTQREVNGLKLGAGTDALRMDPRWYEVWREFSSELMTAIRPYTWVVFPVQVRLVQSKKHLVPWHQDVGYQKILGTGGHKRIMTCWIPMNEIPFRHSTLQFALDENSQLAHTPLYGHGAGLARQEWTSVKHYDLEFGDCLLFGDLTIHRTFVPERCTLARRSLEFRLVCPDDAIEGKDYFNILEGQFVRTDGTAREFP